MSDLVAHPTGRPLRPDALVTAPVRTARRRRAAGLCVRCHAPWTGRTWCCDSCREIQARAARIYRARRTQEQRERARAADRIRHKVYAGTKKARGQCPRGAHPTDRGRGRLCTRCLESYRTYSAERRRSRGTEHRQHDREYHAARWKWARERGLCGECGRTPAAGGSSRCTRCRDRNRQATRRRAS